MENMCKSVYQVDDSGKIYKLPGNVEGTKKRIESSRPGREANIGLDLRVKTMRLFNTYFRINSTCTNHNFRRRTGASRKVLFHLYKTIEKNNMFFQVYKDALRFGDLNFSKCSYRTTTAPS